MKDANTYEGWSLIKDTCVSWDWTHARLIQCLFQLARDRCCPLSVKMCVTMCVSMCVTMCVTMRVSWPEIGVAHWVLQRLKIGIIGKLNFDRIGSDPMCLCLPSTELAYFVSAGTFGSNLYCTWAEVLSTLRRVRAWRFTWNWAAWLGLAWHSLITRGPRKPIIPHATFLSQKRGKIVVRKNPCINSITLKIDPYEEVSDWGPGWVREEAEIKSVISRLKLALSS